MATASTLPRPLTDALTTSRPDTKTWLRVTRLLDATPDADLAAVKKALASWPKELPRQAPKEWVRQRSVNAVLDNRYDRLLALCHDTRENEAHYNLYETAIGTSPLLRLRGGSQAATAFRQQRGEVTLSTGQRLVMGGGQPGLADLGVLLVVEWERQSIAGPNATGRLQLYAEVEVKIDGAIPPGCREFRGSSQRSLSKTEEDQIVRQKAQLQRGGYYGFFERVSECVTSLAHYRDNIIRQLA